MLGFNDAFNTFSAILYQSVIRHLRNSPVPGAFILLSVTVLVPQESLT